VPRCGGLATHPDPRLSPFTKSLASTQGPLRFIPEHWPMRPHYGKRSRWYLSLSSSRHFAS